MQELIWLLEPLHVLLSGGGWEAATRTDGFRSLLVIAAALVPATVILLGIGMSEWEETPLARWFGFGRDAEDGYWPDTSHYFDDASTMDPGSDAARPFALPWAPSDTPPQKDDAAA